MKKQEFIAMVIDRIPEYLLFYDIEEICSKTVRKNNGVSLTGLMILLKGENIAPNIYMEYYYNLYVDGTPMDEILSMIAAEYEKVRSRMDSCKSSEFNLYDMKDNIYMVLVNYERNKELLNDCPYIPFLDLAIVFRYKVSEDEGCISSGLVRKSEQEFWGLTIDELYEKALRNTEKMFPPVLMKLSEKMRQMDGDYEFIPETNLYILSNSINSYGSIYMTDIAKIHELANELSTNFFIIPSSIHEVLLFPDDNSMDRCHIECVVNDINTYVLSDTDYLSQTVYYYDREKNIIEY